MHRASFGGRLHELDKAVAIGNRKFYQFYKGILKVHVLSNTRSFAQEPGSIFKHLFKAAGQRQINLNINVL